MIISPDEADWKNGHWMSIFQSGSSGEMIKSKQHLFYCDVFFETLGTATTIRRTEKRLTSLGMVCTP